MEYQELERRLDEIHDKLLVARDEAQSGLELMNKLTHELLREYVTLKEGRDGGSDSTQR